MPHATQHSFLRAMAFIILATSLASAQNRPLQPAPATHAGFDFREVTLDNGLRVITLEDFSCPIVAVHLWYHVGSKDENPERQGFAHMFEHMMFRGTDRLGPTDHFDFIRRTGGNCNAYTSFDQTVYVQTLPANQLELALWLESERMSFLKIDQDSFDTERKVVEEERRLGLNQPYGTLFEKLFAELFKVHPYQWTPIGKIPHLRASGVQELRDFWTRYYVPNNATLVIVGAVKHDEAQRLAKQYFGWIPRYPDPPRVSVKEPEWPATRDVTFKEDNAPAPVAGIVFRGVPLGHPDYYAVQLAASILGGGQSSRLYRDLVAERELAVAAAAAAFAVEHDGFIAAGAAMTPWGGKPDKVLQAIEQHIERLRAEPVKPEELEKVRNQMLKSLVLENSTVVSKASALGSAAVLEGNTANVNSRIDAIRAVTVPDIQRAVTRYFTVDRAVRAKVQSNLLGTLFGRKDNPEDDAPITATPETNAPPPGRQGLTRPSAFPAQPPVAGLLEFDPRLNYQSSTLANGLKVMVVENHELPLVSVQLGLLAGAWTEQKPGTASLALSMLTRGTARHSEGELAEELERYAIDLSASAGADSSTVFANTLTEHLERALNLMAETVLTPTFPADEYKKLQQQTLTGLAVATNEPSYIADRELNRRIFGAHPYARQVSGEVEDVKALSADDLKQWWTTFARPDMATLIFSGDIDLARATALAQAAFGQWQVEGPRPDVQLPSIPEPGLKRIYLVDRPGVQSQIRVGHLGITRQHPDYFVSRVASSYFGGAFNARLNETIRVQKGLTYGARGGWDSQRFAGSFEISTFSKTDSTVEAVEAIFGEIDRLRTDPPTDKELGDTKTYTLGSFAAGRETPQQVAGQLWQIEALGLPQDYYEQYLRQVAATTAQDCQRLAQSTVDPDRAIVVVVGPAAKLKEKLEAIAPVTVVTPESSRDEP